MNNVLTLSHWASAAVGVLLLVIAIVIAVTSTRRTSPSRTTFGWFAVQFGLALIMFNVAGAISSNHAWSIVALVTGVVLLAASLRHRPWGHRQSTVGGHRP